MPHMQSTPVAHQTVWSATRLISALRRCQAGLSMMRDCLGQVRELWDTGAVDKTTKGVGKERCGCGQV